MISKATIQHVCETFDLWALDVGVCRGDIVTLLDQLMADPGSRGWKESIVAINKAYKETYARPLRIAP